MSDNQLKNTAWLRKKYVSEQMSQSAIAQEVGCSPTTVSRYLDLAGIRKRPKPKAPQTFQEQEQLWRSWGLNIDERDLKRAEIAYREHSYGLDDERPPLLWELEETERRHEAFEALLRERWDSLKPEEQLQAIAILRELQEIEGTVTDHTMRLPDSAYGRTRTPEAKDSLILSLTGKSPQEIRAFDPDLGSVRVIEDVRRKAGLNIADGTPKPRHHCFQG